MSERAEGFYWVQTPAGWQVAEWRDRCWWLTGNETAFRDLYMRQVGARIEREGTDR